MILKSLYFCSTNIQAQLPCPEVFGLMVRTVIPLYGDQKALNLLSLKILEIDEQRVLFQS